MSYINMNSGRIDSVVVDYVPATPREIIRVGPASARLRLLDNDGSPIATVFLDMDIVRQLAESLPDLVMSHDAEARALAEQAAAIAEVG
ncbi:hypothetical protein AB0J48_26595 [Nocardia salmonicida]|uniref:hypothetical protein n=1 Tax=Nocardia salmonicida TaxID=53431 RepID=UPI0034127599